MLRGNRTLMQLGVASPGAYPLATFERQAVHPCSGDGFLETQMLTMTDELDDAAPVRILIDGSHVDRLRSKLNRLSDLKALTEHYAQTGRAVSAVYFRDTRDEAEQLRQSRLFDWRDRHRIEQ